MTSISGNNLSATDPVKTVETPTSPFSKKMLHFSPYCSPNEFLPPPLEGFACACVDDQVYIFGGSDLNGQETADLYSFSLKCGWYLVQPKGQPGDGKPTSRVAAAMAAYNKKLYVFGGVNEKQGWLNDFYEFDTENLVWQRLGSADTQNHEGPTPRDKCALIAARDKIYLYGGFGPRKHITAMNGNSAPSEISVTAISGDSTADRMDGSNGGAAANNDSNNNTNQIDEPNTGEEEAKALLEAAQKDQTAAEFDYFSDFYCFDPSNGTWSAVEIDDTSCSPTTGGDISATPPGLAAYTVCTMADKLLYFGGKTSNGDRTNNVYCFALGLKKWLPLQIRDDFCWPAGRSFHSSVVVHDRYLITFGGRDGEEWERDDMWVFDTNTTQWLSAQTEGVGGVSAPCARYGHALTVLPDADSRQHLVIYGGSAELDPASGVAQDVLTDMYIVPVDELLQVCAPVIDQLEEGKETNHQHHALHFHRSAGGEESSSNDEPPATKIPRCDDCIDL